MPRTKKTNPDSSLIRQVSDNVRFLRSWIEKPLQIGAIAPSSPALAQKMASYIDPTAEQSVVELGPGTGVVTQAILNQGIRPDRLVSIEYDPGFATILRDRFPGVRIVRGDAYAIKQEIADLAEAPLAAVVSSLPLFTRPLPQRLQLLNDAFDVMAPGAPFIQFSYAFVPAVPAKDGITVECSDWVMMNLPPARVWIFRRSMR